MPNASIYYEANVANTYAETAAGVVGPVESLAYYNLQDGSVPPVPIVGGVGVETSHLLTDSGPVIYETLSSDRVITANDSVEARPTAKHDVAVVGGGTDLSSAVVPSALTSTQASTTSNVKENISVTSTDGVTTIEAAPAPSKIAKAQSKVIRNKKKTIAVAHSMRSNKKVNSLVDKWKAVKEELNENAEDEPENLYEILEKKRQREIEEWHARQIASGEAGDNANFQPLGGDWYVIQILDEFEI
uniref:Uncharacterized protein LOC8275726 isoform X2 n=1 Tax=Rhizophora mucronata TaxID=61149 RepID=A0A2P2JPJ8_RHIMU